MPIAAPFNRVDIMNSSIAKYTDRTGARAAPLILLVDDNDNDSELVRIALDDLHRGIRLTCVRDGEACMEYLERRAGYETAERPDLVLLDLQMPRMSGLDVLRAIGKSTIRELKRIPVVVLTTSSAARDIDEAYQFGCKSYILKPLGYSEFASAIARLCEYWFDFNTALKVNEISPADKGVDP